MAVAQLSWKDDRWPDAERSQFHPPSGHCHSRSLAASARARSSRGWIRLSLAEDPRPRPVPDDRLIGRQEPVHQVVLLNHATTLGPSVPRASMTGLTTTGWVS